MHPSHAALGRPSPADPGVPAPMGAWEATMPADDLMATRIMRGEKEYLAPAEREIGRLTAPNLRELFVSCDAAEALRQQFEHLQSRHIALHDLGSGTIGTQLLRQLAAMGGGAVQQLVIRQQGYGTTLATVQYADYTAPGGQVPVRVYSTNVQATPAAQEAVARAMLELAQASVLLLREQATPSPAQSLRQALQMVHRGPWVCPNLLVMPLGPQAAAAAAAQCSQVVQRNGLLLRASPQPAKGSDAWAFILGFWQKNEGRGRLAPTATASVPPLALLQLRPSAQEPDAPAPLMPAPPRAASSSAQAPGATVASNYVEHVRQLTGLLACCVFDVSTGAPLGHAGHSLGPLEMARQGSALLHGQETARLALGLTEPAEELLISSQRHHQVVRPLPGHAGLALHALLDRSKTNQSLVRFQLQRIDGVWAR